MNLTQVSSGHSTKNTGSYSNFIQAAKRYANQGESQRLQLMMLLLDMEPRKSIWQDNPNETISWDLLLREEGLCTPALFHDFKRAIKIVPVDVFGVYASAAIAKLKVDYRSRVLRSTQKWIDSHNVPPTYQRITKYVSNLKREMGIRGKPKTPLHVLKAQNNQLRRDLSKAEDYIETLQAALRNAGLRIPKEPK